MKARAWFLRLKPYRAYVNFVHSDGNLLAAGMAFQALFALFAAVWVGFWLTGFLLAGNTALTTALVDLVNRAVPGLIGVGGVIHPDALHPGGTLGWTGAIAAAGLLWTAISWLFYTRQAVRAIFGLPRDATPWVLQKARDLGLACAFGIVLVASAALTIASTQARGLAFAFLGLASDSFWTVFSARVSGLLVSLMLNIVVLGSMFRVLARVPIPLRRLTAGATLGAAALSGLSVLGGLVLGGATANPLFATFAVFIGLLIWFNLVCRVILLAASWIAVGMQPAAPHPPQAVGGTH